MNNRAKEDGIRLVMKAKETVSIILALFFLLVYLIGFGAISCVFSGCHHDGQSNVNACRNGTWD